MILTMACFYLILGACGILVHILRKRPHRSALNYISRVIFAGGWILLPLGALSHLGLQFPTIPLPVVSLIGGTVFLVILQRGAHHVDPVE